MTECQNWIPVQLDWLNSAVSPVVYGDIAPSIKTQYNTIQKRINWVCISDVRDKSSGFKFQARGASASAHDISRALNDTGSI